jgi:hypothetical protein
MSSGLISDQPDLGSIVAWWIKVCTRGVFLFDIQPRLNSLLLRTQGFEQPFRAKFCPEWLLRGQG